MLLNHILLSFRQSLIENRNILNLSDVIYYVSSGVPNDCCYLKKLF